MADLVGLDACALSDDDEESLIEHFDVCSGRSGSDDDPACSSACMGCKALQEKIKELEQQVAMLHQDRRERKEEELGLRKQLSDLYAGENAHFRSWKDQVDRMSGYEREIIRLKGDLWLAEHNNEVLKQSLQKYEDESKALKTLQNNFNELQEARDHYSNEARKLHEECGTLQDENGKQRCEIADLKRQRDDWKDVAMRVTDLLPAAAQADAVAEAAAEADAVDAPKSEPVVQTGKMPSHRKRQIPESLQGVLVKQRRS